MFVLNLVFGLGLGFMFELLWGFAVFVLFGLSCLCWFKLVVFVLLCYLLV